MFKNFLLITLRSMMKNKLFILLAGAYPAFYISKFEPISILKGKLKFGGTNYFTRTLLGLQFAISLIAIVCAIAFLQNAKYQEAYDLGFASEMNQANARNMPGAIDLGKEC